MPTLYDKLTDDQVQIILDGVKNDVDYDVIAAQVGFSHKRRVTDFLTYRIVHQFTDQRRAKSLEECK